MSEQNKAILIRWFEEVWNQERPEAVDELMGADCVLHDGKAVMRGPADFHAFRARLHEYFSDIRVQVQEAAGEGDIACVRWTSTMRHKGTGAPLSTTGMSMVRFKDGRLEEGWQNWDEAGLMSEIEALPARASASA